MPRAVPILTNFTAGELSPKLTGRVDLAKYYNGCLTLENMLIHPHGGASRRPGTYFVTSALYGNKRCRLVPFEFSVTQAYILEFGDLYIRVFKDGGIVGDVDSYTKLLLHCDGDDASTVFTDDGYTGHTVTTHGNVKVDTSDKVFGTGSALFPGAVGDYLSVADHADWFQDTGKFNINFRFKLNVPASGDFSMAFAQQYEDGLNYWVLYYRYTASPESSDFRFASRTGGIDVIAMDFDMPGDAKIDDEWHHLALIRGWGGNVNDWAITLDGVQLDNTATDATAVGDHAASLEIGKYFTGAANMFAGKMDEIQVSKGIARETTDFAPYDRAHPVSPTAVNITTPYLESELRQLQFAQSADVLYITHPNHAPRKLSRTSHTDWTLSVIDFIDGPYDEEVTAALSTTAASGQATIALKGDGTHYLLYDAQTANFTVGDVLSGGTSLATAKIMADDDWTDEGCLTIAAISGTFQNNETITDPTVPGSATSNGTIGDGYLTYDTEAVAEPAVAEVFTGGTSGATGTVRGLQDDGDTGKMVLEMGANSVDFVVGETATGGTSGTTVVVVTFTRAHGTLFTSDDVGAPFRYFFDTTWTWLEIKSVIDDITAIAIVRGVDITAAADASKYRKGTWKIDDYPGSVTFHEQKLIFAANNNKPQTIWGSEAGDYETFTPGVGDSNPFTYTIASDRVNAIRWLKSSGILIPGTIGGEWIARGTGIDEPITPTNIWVKPTTTYGSAIVNPIKIGQALLFLQRQERKLREFVLSPDSVEPIYVAPDMTILAEHITRGGIKEMAYQQEPDSIVWTVRADGVLPGMTYNRPQEVIGWHRHITDGEFESVAVIPGDGEDQVWVVVKRTIGGSDVRYIEYFTSSLWDDVTDGIYVDSALTYEGAEVTTLTNLNHLEGEEVAILTNKGVHPNQTVSGNEISLDWGVTKAHVGKSYASVLQTMSLEAGQREGTAQGKVKRIHKATLRLYETLGCEFGRDLDHMDTIPFRMAGDPMDALPPLFTGDKEVVFPGDYTKNAYVFVRQQQPLPLTVLAIIPHMATHDE